VKELEIKSRSRKRRVTDKKRRDIAEDGFERNT
jgi:hypothetical protein